MARSKLVLTVLGAAAALAAGCGSVAADAGNASGTGHSSAQASATARPAASGSGSGSAAAGPGQANAVGGPIRGVSQLLCSAPGAASQVIITRTGAGGPITPGGTAVSAYRSAAVRSAVPVVKGAAQASALARAVCGLPAMPRGILRCPNLTSPGYQLTFSADGRLLPAVLVQPTGCETVTGAGAVRSAASRPSFLKLLTSMAGPLPLPGSVHLPGNAHLPGRTAGGAPLRPAGAAQA
jgi:hypothetical protein